jgi:hypothetical protein
LSPVSVAREYAPNAAKDFHWKGMDDDVVVDDGNDDKENKRVL